jgi:hypothetical protein
MTIRRALAALTAAIALMVPACASDMHLDLLGYTTRPRYDTSFRTVRIPMVKNRSNFTVTPVVGQEMDLHRALVREMALRTPYRVCHGEADTELSVTIRSITKGIINYTQQNNLREAELRVEAEVVWRDLRTGKALTRSSPRPGDQPESEERQPLLDEGVSTLPPGSRPVTTPSRPSTPATARADEEPLTDPSARRQVVPVIVRASGHYRPELGESITTAQQRAFEQLAVQITQILENPWTKGP